MRFDVLVLGRLVPMAELGVYSIALTLGAVPNQISDKIAGLVLLPALSASYRDNHAALVSSFARARRTLLPLGGLVFLAGALVAPAFFAILYDSRYHAAGWMAQLSMLQVWFSYLHETSSRALLAVGDSRSLAVSNAVKLLASAVACIGGYLFAGLPGCILGTGVGALTGYTVVVLALRRNGLPTARQDAGYTLAGIAIAIGVTLAARTAASTLALASPLVPGLVLAVVVLSPCAVWAGLRLRQEIRR
jgi:O-antigen/teichoic acid export membrane protein